MNTIRLVAVILIVVGALGLIYGTFSYTSETHDIKMGPVEMTVKEKQTVNIPVWGGVGAIGAGVVLLLVGKKS
jgi:hypothetical protein